MKKHYKDKNRRYAMTVYYMRIEASINLVMRDSLFIEYRTQHADEIIEVTIKGATQSFKALTGDLKLPCELRNG